MTVEARLEFAGFNKLAPDARAALSALSKAVDDSGLEKGLTELIKILIIEVCHAKAGLSGEYPRWIGRLACRYRPAWRQTTHRQNPYAPGFNSERLNITVFGQCYSTNRK